MCCSAGSLSVGVVLTTGRYLGLVKDELKAEYDRAMDVLLG